MSRSRRAPAASNAATASSAARWPRGRPSSSPRSSVASQRKRSASSASSASARSGPSRRSTQAIWPFETRKPKVDSVVVRQAHRASRTTRPPRTACPRRIGAARRCARTCLDAEPAAELLERLGAPGRKPELAAAAARGRRTCCPTPTGRGRPSGRGGSAYRDRVDVRPARCCSRRRASTPGPQSSSRRPVDPRRGSPDWAPPGFGHAGEQPTTVNFTLIYLPRWRGRSE